jgi:hypothetical protein
MDDLGAPILGNHQISTDPQQISTVSMQVPWNPATQELLGLLQTWRWQKNPDAFLVVTASYVPNNWLRSIYNPGMAPNILIYHPWRIHGAIYGAPWIPSRKTPVMLAFIYQHQPDPSWVKTGYWFSQVLVPWLGSFPDFPGPSATPLGIVVGAAPGLLNLCGQSEDFSGI